MNVMKLAFARALIYIETIVLGLQKVMARRNGKIWFKTIEGALKDVEEFADGLQ
jgi:hypothetical protein